MISLETLISYWKIGFKLVPLNELSNKPTIAWSEMYTNPGFWSEEKIRKYSDTFYNVSTTFGQTNVSDTQGRELYLYCLDIDSEDALKRLNSLLEEEWKLKTFVTKTQKDCGFHVYWFERHSENEPISIELCKKGFEFEIKCGKSLCTLPPSRHRDNPLFHYENVGQQDKVMIADGLYERLVNDILKECLKRKKKHSNLKKKYTVSKHGENTDKSSSTLASPQIPEVHKGYDAKSEQFSSRLPTTPTKIILTDKQIEDSTQYLMFYYQNGTRDKFAFGFSGLCYKEDIDEASASKILENICKRTNDPEVDARLGTLHRTYINGTENGSNAITGKIKLKEVIIHVSNCDDKSAEIIIRCLLRFWRDNNDDDSEEDKNNIGINTRETVQSPELGKELLLLKNELSTAGISNPVEFTIGIINKTVKRDDSLVRAVFYAASSTWTFDPMNIGISAPTSEGKTYTVLQTLQYFPSKDIRLIGSMSPKVIIRQEGILVDADTLKPIQDDIDTLKEQIENEKNQKHKRDLQEELQDLLANARLLIDLRGKIYVFLEAPDPDLWKIIKPIMSHDNFVIEHPYVESFQGISVKSIITLGFPTFIFCTAKDESRWEQWDEIASRSLVISPNMSKVKYREANILNSQLLGLPTAMQESLIRSRKDIELAKKCVLYLKLSITKVATINLSSDEDRDFRYNNPVWIPYAEILGNTLPADKGTEMRINRRLLLLLRIIALTKADLRYQVIFANQTLTIAAIEDLTEALYIM